MRFEHLSYGDYFSLVIKTDTAYKKIADWIYYNTEDIYGRKLHVSMHANVILIDKSIVNELKAKLC